MSDANRPDRHLPARLTSFVGRQAELTDLQRLVCKHRLVTLIGAGGVGKTRLALQLADMLVTEFVDGAWWVDLAPVTDPDLVADRVARALDLTDHPGRWPAEDLIRFIDDRRLLLVLDNCEHLLDVCAALITTLLDSCARLRIVTTSREPIGVKGELTWPTPSLSLTDEAVELFTQRARLGRPDFTANGDDAAAVTEICRRLDGIPLAIELAARRVRVLSLTEIIDGLSDRLVLLTDSGRTVVPRQQTLRASVDWSHALLSGSEQLVFRRLAVFVGGFDLHAAHAVAGDAGVQRDQIQLVDKSLVLADSTGPTTRYRMLETVRQYALEKLAESGEAGAVNIRHRDHYAALFDTPASARVPWYLNQAEIEIDNLRAAFRWSLEHDDVEQATRLASALLPLWIHTRTSEGLSWFDAVLNHTVTASPAAHAGALADKTILEAFAGEYYRIDQAEQALAIARDLNDPALLTRALAACGFTYCYSPEIALRYITEAIEIAPALANDWLLSQLHGVQAFSAYVAGDLVTLSQAAEKGRDLAEAVGDWSTSRVCRFFLVLAQLHRGNVAEATEAARKLTAEAEAGVARDPLLDTQSLVLLAECLACQGDTDGARAAAEASIEAARDLPGFHRSVGFGALVDASLAAGDLPTALTASDALRNTCALPQLLAVNGNPVAKAVLACGDVPAARKWADDALSVASGVHRRTLLEVSARVAIAEGETERAERDARDALAVAAAAEAYLTTPDIIESLATVATGAACRHREAARLFGSAAGIRERIGLVRYRIHDADCLAAVNTLRAAMQQNDFEREWAAGAALSTAAAIAEAGANSSQDQRERPTDGWDSLTPAELNVVQLVVEGLRNKEVAEKLSISPRTVHTHLTHIYTKLGLSSRLQLAHEAARRG